MTREYEALANHYDLSNKELAKARAAENRTPE